MIEETTVSHGIPITTWRPPAEALAVVLLGHGLGVDRFHEGNRLAAERFTRDHQIAAVAPELPLHGELADADQPDIVTAWQSFWSQGGMQSLLADWQRHHQLVRDVFPDRSVGYFGLSLGTQYGIPFVAEQPDICAACFGLFGSRPAPKTPVMNHYAPRVSCPVFFVQQLDDEIHPAATTTHLYDSLGSADKVLSASPGLHAELPAASYRLAVDFVAKHLLG